MSGSNAPYPLLLVALADTELRLRILDGLPNFGWRVLTASSESEILPLLLQHQPDALLVDADTISADSAFLALHPPTAALLAPDARTAALHLLTTCQVSQCLWLPLDLELIAASLVALTRRPRPEAEAIEACTAPTPHPEAPRAGEDQGTWQLDLTSWRLLNPQGEASPLSQQEARFLAALASAPGVAVDRRQVIASMGHALDYYDPRRLDTLLSRLRSKVNKSSTHSLPVRSIHGVGFAFAAPITLAD